MNIIVLTRLFESVPESDCLIIDFDLCSTPEELIFRKEIEDALNNGDEYIENPSRETKDIMSGGNQGSFSKLNFCGGPNWMKPTSIGSGTIQYGPTVCM